MSCSYCEQGLTGRRTVSVQRFPKTYQEGLLMRPFYFLPNDLNDPNDPNDPNDLKVFNDLKNKFPKTPKNSCSRIRL